MKWKWVTEDGSAYLVREEFDPEKQSVFVEDGTIIADDGSADGEYDRVIEPDSPYAHLIAAAPELLEACKVVKAYLDKLEDGTDKKDPLAAIRKRFHAPLRAALEPAIANAEGRTPPPGRTQQSPTEPQQSPEAKA